MRMSYPLAALFIVVAVVAMLAVNDYQEQKAACEADGGDWTRHGYGKRAWYDCEHR